MLPTGEEGDNGQPGPCTMLAEGDVSVQDYSSREGGEALRVPSSQAHRQPYGFIGPEFCSLPRRSRMLASQSLMGLYMNKTPAAKTQLPSESQPAKPGCHQHDDLLL
jgi:hypothetical protein